jgi:integrase
MGSGFQLSRMIECHEDPIAAAYAVVLGETAIRKSEGIRLTWSFVDVQHRLLTVERSKNRRPRYIPLSDFALEALQSLPRLKECPRVFVRLETGSHWHDLRKPFERAKKKAGLEWVGFHGLRHFRASRWVMQGADIRTVQELLGNQEITTTMRYAHFAPHHAMQSSREIQRREAESFVSAQEKNRRRDLEGGEGNGISSGNLLIPLMPKGGLEPPRPCER